MFGDRVKKNPVRGSYAFWLSRYDPEFKVIRGEHVVTFFPKVIWEYQNTCGFAVCHNKDTKDWACWLQLHPYPCKFRHKKHLTWVK
jgi:hypothetical protein